MVTCSTLARFNNFNNVCGVSIFQVTTDIERIFENEGWLLDRTSVIDPDDDAIEHRKLLDWVCVYN